MNPSSEIIKRKSILSPLNDWLDQGYWQLRSTKVGALAGLLWLASLACPALINYGGDIYGYLVLLIGWITLSGFLVAWAANIFFLWALWRLLKGYGSALLLSWIAVICSVDTIRFANIRGYDNINSSDLYGFGLGALIWFAALLLMGIAASFRALEMAHQDKAVARPLKFARWSSVCAMFALLALLIVGAVHQGMYQRRMAAPAEREFLARAIFKLGTVCTTPDIEPQTTIRLSGPVELITDDKNVTALYYGSLLQWGVPVVRYKGVDYSLRDHDDSSSVVISPPIGDVAATLRVSEKTYQESGGFISPTVDIGREITATMTSTSGEVAFAGTWRGVHHYCPTFKLDAKSGEPPGSLVLSVLRTLEGTVLTAAGTGTGYPGSRYTQAKVLAVSAGVVVSRDGLTENPGCPPGIGVIHPAAMKTRHEPLNPTLALASADFTDAQMIQMGSSFHSWPRIWDEVMLCAGEVAYLANGQRSPGGSSLNLEKRRLPDLALLWRKVVAVSFAAPPTDTPPDRLVHLQSVKEVGDRITAVAAYALPTDTRATVVQVEILRPPDAL